MSRKKLNIKAISGLVLLTAVALAMAGCSTTTSTVQNLNHTEAEKLLEMQAAERMRPATNDDVAPPDADTLESRGDSMALNHQYQAAIFQYQRSLVISDDPAKTRLRHKMGLIFMKTKQWLQAISLFKQVTEVDTANPEAWQSLGLSLLATNDLDEAWEALLQAVNLDDSLWKAHNGLGMIYNYRGMSDQAADSFKKAVSLQPDHVGLYNNLGLALSLGDRLTESEAAYRQALTIDHDNKLVNNNLGLLLARMNRDKEALQAFTKSVGKAQAHNNLGVVKAWNGDTKNATRQFRKAVSEMPRFYGLAQKHLQEVDLSSDMTEEEGKGLKKVDRNSARKEKGPQAVDINSARKEKGPQEVDRNSDRYYAVQFGVFRKYQNAANLVAQLTKVGLDPRVVKKNIKGKTMLKVWVGSYTGLSLARKAQAKFKGLIGLPSIIVRD